MAKNQFPSTTLQPTQVLDFILSDNQRVRAVFLPQPDQTGNTVSHVALVCVYAGLNELTPMPQQTRPQSIIQAAQLAFRFAQSETQRLNTTIASAILEGDEFLEVADVEQITSNAFPVTLKSS